MSLRKKTLITIGSVLLCSVAIMYLVLRSLFLGGFLTLEEQAIRREVERTLNALADDLSKLSALVGDWAGWDDTYAFIEDANPEYIRSNLVDQTFSELDLNLMVFVHSSGRIVFAKAFDLQEKREVPVPEGLLNSLTPESPLLRLSPPREESPEEEGLTGLLLLAEGPLLLAARPILTSEKAGPSRGSLIMGRYLDAAKVAQLAELTDLSLVFRRVDEPTGLLDPDFAAARTALLLAGTGATLPVQRLDRERIAGYALLRDIYGQPALILRVDLPRTIYSQGLASLNYFMLALFAVGLVFTATTLLLLERGVLAKLARLERAVRRVTARGDLSARLPAEEGGAELARLVFSINEMLARIEASQLKLRESETRFKLLFERLADAVFITSYDGKILEANEAALRQTGYSREELLGLNIMRDLAAREPAITYDQVNELLARGETVYFEEEKRRKDGSTYWTECAVTPIEFQGRPATLSVNREITERKRLEQLKAEFLATVSHEVRTPLTSIKGYADLLLAGETGPLNPTQEEFLQIISRNADRLTELISDLLEIERLESGERKIELRDLALDEILRDVAATFAVNAREKGLALEVELEEGLQVKGDADYLARAFANLLSNAIKYTKEGKVSLRAYSDSEAGEAVVEFEDTGIGMTPEELSRLFTRFYRSTNPYVREATGTGLGLAIVKATIDRHGGEIKAESAPNAGTKFTVRLPLSKSWLKLGPDGGPTDQDG
ncbi:MAG: CHASE4 domain-containing protein [Candidatus Bipolaricaulia bacterium]